MFLLRAQKFPFFRLLALCVVLIGASLPITGCDLTRNQLKYDRERNKELQSYRDGLAPRLPDVKKDDKVASSSGSGIPELQPYVASSSAAMKSMPLVSISVNQSVPLRDVLYELAQQAHYDLELDPHISGSIIFNVHDQPLDDVVRRIADNAGLRYKFDGNSLHIEVDTPYNKTYHVDYLSYIRKNKGSIRNNVAVVTGDGADTGSSYEAAGESEANFWGELEQNLQQILGANVNGALKTKKTPKITASSSNPQAAGGADKAGTPAAGGENGQAVLKVEALPTDQEDDDPTNAPTQKGSAGDNPSGATFTINRQAGLINVYATDKAQKEVEEYLHKVKKAVASQVLIEAKILEVTFDDEHSAGIDWRALQTGRFHANFLSSGSSATTLNGLNSSTYIGNTAVGVGGLTVTPPAGSSFMIGVTGDDVDAIISAISGFGTVKALASPRVTVLNNQSAVMNVANNHVYFQLKVNVTASTATTAGTTDITSDIHNVPEGVLVNVQPSINMDDNTISLALRPTITRITDNIRDPAVEYITATAVPPITTVHSTVPQLNVQEIDSVIKLRSGEPIVLGGLMQDRTEIAENGVPVASEVPIVGSLFKKHADSIHKTELVIFMKATILPDAEDSIDDADRDIYRAFSGDRHPMKL